MIFTREDGTPIRLAYPNDKLNEIIRSNKLPKITVHGLRHTHASLLFEAGASIKEVQECLGHSDIKITMNIYTYVTKQLKKKMLICLKNSRNLILQSLVQMWSRMIKNNIKMVKIWSQHILSQN